MNAEQQSRWKFPLLNKATLGSMVKRTIMLSIMDHANKDGRCWPSQRTIAAESNASVRSVSQHLKELADMGVVALEEREEGWQKVITVNFRRLYELIPEEKRKRLPAEMVAVFEKQAELLRDRVGRDLKNHSSTRSAPSTSCGGVRKSCVQSKSRTKSESKTPESEPQLSKRDLAEQMVEVWNKVGEGILPKVRAISDTRVKHLNARLSEEPLAGRIEYWENLVHFILKSDFLSGRSRPGRDREQAFVCDIDFVARQSSFIKIVEGKYHQGSPFEPGERPSEAQLSRRDWDVISAVNTKGRSLQPGEPFPSGEEVAAVRAKAPASVWKEGCRPAPPAPSSGPEAPNVADVDRHGSRNSDLFRRG